MNEDLFHVMALAQHHHGMAYNHALALQATCKNGTKIKEAWDVVKDKEYRYQKAMNDYLNYKRDMDKEFA